MSEETAAPVEGQAAPAPAEATADWTSGFDADMKGYIENKGFTNPSDLANGYRNLEKLRGVPAEQLVQWPDDPSNREAMAPVYAKMGMPEQADQYTRVLDDTFDNGVFDNLALQAHQLGLGDGQFQGLQQTFAEQAQAIMEQQEAQAVEVFDQWQTANPDGFQAAARVMAEVGMDETQVEGVLNGDKAALYDFLAKVGSRTGESEIVTGDAPEGGFNMSKDAAQSKINDLLADETFMRQYTNSSKAIRGPAIERIEKLQKIVAG